MQCALAIGTASDPELGSPLFVSSRHIGIELNRAAWNSTTPYLSVLVAPRLAPTRLVVDPGCRLLLEITPDRATERSIQHRNPGSDAATRQDIRLPAPLVRGTTLLFCWRRSLRCGPGLIVSVRNIRQLSQERDNRPQFIVLGAGAGKAWHTGHVNAVLNNPKKL